MYNDNTTCVHIIGIECLHPQRPSPRLAIREIYVCMYVCMYIQALPLHNDLCVPGPTIIFFSLNLVALYLSYYCSHCIVLLLGDSVRQTRRYKVSHKVFIDVHKELCVKN